MSRTSNLHKLLSTLLFGGLLAWPLSAASIGAATDGFAPERPAEYMVYQYARTALVLKLDAPGLEFSVRTMGPEATLVKASALPGRRMGPLYQFIDSFERARQLMIEVTPARPVNRDSISLEVQQFATADPNAGILSRAFRLMSAGTEAVHSSDTSTWASKSGALRSAANIFGGLGMEEMRLWCDYFSALIVLNQLLDPLSAGEFANEIRVAAMRAGLQQLELAAVVLAADAQFELAVSQGSAANSGKLAAARVALAAAADLADAQGIAVESGRAIYREGLLLEREGEPEQALERYRLALERVMAGGDSELANEIRATSAALHESLGRTSGALALIDTIAEDLATTSASGGEAELAASLFEKGRLLNASYRYAEAVPVLSQGIELRPAGSMAWGDIALELGWSLYALGEYQRAAVMLESGLQGASRGGAKQPVVRALGALATLRREQGRHVDAARSRDEQGALLGDGPGRAGYLFESAMDSLARAGPGLKTARDLLVESGLRARQEGDEVTQYRARLWLCLLRSEQPGPTACDLDDAAADAAALRASGIPAAAAEATLLQARLLDRAGRRRQALDQMQALLTDLYWFRSVLPGVLGPWYPQQRDTVSRSYLEQARPEGSGDGRALLLASEQLRLLEAADLGRPEDVKLGEADDDALRSLLGRREAATGAEGRQLAGELEALLERVRAAAQPSVAMMSSAEMDALLARLEPSEAVLGFLFDGRRSLALLGRSRNVQLIPLPGASTALDRLVQLRSLLERSETQDVAALLASLGQDLIAPLRNALPEVLFLLSSGPIRGVPLDALRVDGVPLAERHLLIGLHGLGSLASGRPRLPVAWRERVFAAGNPQNLGDPFSLELAASPELAAVTDLFVGPGLQVIQGVALQKHEFNSDRLGSAALLHLALPGTIDLDAPERSKLRLSAGPDELAGTWLAPRDIRSLALDNPLVVLTATVCSGDGEPDYARRLAFADDFIEAGAQAVLMTLWMQPESDRLAFVSALYDALESTADIAAALAQAKRAAIAADGGRNLGGWAGFQLFIR